MKTNSVFELLRAKGVKVESKPESETKVNEPIPASKPKRTRLYHFDDPTPEKPLSKPIQPIPEPTREGVASSVASQIEAKELDSNKTAVKPLYKDSISTATGQQIDSKTPFIRQQQDSISTANKTAVDVSKIELDSISPAESPAVRQPLDSKSRSFYEVVGKERELLIFVFKQMVFQGGNSTRPISTDELKSGFGISAKRLGNLVERLILKKALLIEKGQRGRSSWRVFSLPKNIYHEIRAELGSEKPIRQQLDSIYTSKWTAESPADPSRSSSNDLTLKNLNQNTTTTDDTDPWISVPENLGKVPIRQLREAGREGGMSHEDLQQSLDHFGFDMANGKVNSRTPNKIAVLIGSLKKGGYFSQECQSQLDQALDQVSKRREQIKQTEASAVTAKLKLEFDEWTKANPEEFENLKNGNPFLKNFKSPKMIETVVFPKWLETVKLKTSKDPEV